MKLFAVIAVLLVGFLPMPAAAHQIEAGQLVIHHPWIRETPVGASTAAGYAEIENKGNEPDRLLSVEIKGAAKLEIHSIVLENNVAIMRPSPDGIEIPAHATIELEPGSTHFMLTGLRSGFVDSEIVSGSMTFEHAGRIEVDFMVEPLSAASQPVKHH